METQEQYLSMAGIMYESVKENWKKTGREKKIIKETQQKITKVMFRQMPEFLEHRQRYIKTKEIQEGYKQNKTQFKMTKDGKTQLIYTGEEMTVIDGRMAPEKTCQQEMSKDKRKVPKREMYKTDRQWTLEDYRAVQMLNTGKERTKRRRSVIGIRTQEEVDDILGKVENIRHLINTEPEKAKCEICERADINKNLKISKDKNKWCRECRQKNQQHEYTCNECGIWEMDMADNRCERCWTTTLAEKVIAEREETCWEKGCTKKGTRKFFGHSVYEKHAKNIPGPLEVYAASWISAGDDIDVINEGLDKIFNKGE